MKIRHRNGFTIIEVLIAMAIFSMVLLAIYSSWTSILRAAKVGTEAAAEVQRSRVAVRALEESLASAVIVAENLKHYNFFVDTSDKFTYLSFVARLPKSFPGSGLFGDDDLRRISFSVEGGSLILRQNPLLEATEMVGKPYEIILARNVRLFEVEFWHPRQNEWLEDWIWTNQLPKMGRVALSFGGTGKVMKEDLVMRVITMTGSTIAGIVPGGAPGAGGAPAGGQRGVIGGPGEDEFDALYNSWRPDEGRRARGVFSRNPGGMRPPGTSSRPKPPGHLLDRSR